MGEIQDAPGPGYTKHVQCPAQLQQELHLQTTKLALDKGKGVVETTTNALTGLEAGEYYISMTAKNTKPNEKGCVFYNVTATLEPAVMDALAMPERDGSPNALADSGLNLTDALSSGGYDADALANASASALAERNDKSGWLNLASLA